MSDAGHVIDVAAVNERAGDDMVAEHLPMVLPTFLHVKHKDLLDPASSLDQVVPLEKSIDFADWPVGPEFSQIVKVLAAQHHFLRSNRVESQSPKLLPEL